MTSRWVNPVNNNILRDTDDTVLASGSVQFYAAGTSTPLEVYSDSALTTSLGTYVDADINGLLPDFHMSAGTEYKAVAYDAIGGEGGSGAVQWTRDEVFSADSSVDTRLDTLEATTAALGEAGRNVLINGGMRVTRTNSAPSLTTSFQQGIVADVWGKVSANVSAGTLSQAESTDYVSGHYCLFSGVTTTGSADVVTQFRVNSEDAARFVDQPASFKCKVYQDTGGALTYTITLKKANAKDDFSALTTIATSSGDSVSDVTNTAITYSTADMGDCSNGVVVEVSVPANSVTTKNFRITEAQLEPVATSTAFSELPFRIERAGVSPDTGVVQLSTTTVSSGTTVDFLNVFASNTEYKHFLIELDGVTFTGGIDRIGVRVSIDGSTSVSGAGNYTYANEEYGFGAGGGANGTATGIPLTNGTATAGTAFDGYFCFSYPAETGRTTIARGNIGRPAADCQTFGRYNATNDDVTGFQLYLYGGVATGFNGGTVTVYGSNVPF